jgi:hypothetical protein
MANGNVTIFIPIIVIFTVVAVMVIVALSNIKKTSQSTSKRYRAVRNYHTNGHRYISGQFSEQMELDMRLPYRRFRQLYPESRWTYEEYKRMQMQTAFRRSYSSQDNKRMVR